jgi:hypothetical protein
LLALEMSELFLEDPYFLQPPQNQAAITNGTPIIDDTFFSRLSSTLTLTSLKQLLCAVLVDSSHDLC